MEREFQALVVLLDARLSEGDRDTVVDYIDHNEMGVAFDHLLYALFDEPEQPVPLSPSEADSILRLGKAMEYDANSDIVYKIFLSTYFPEEVARVEET